MKCFEPIEIKGLRLENRFVRSATHEGMAGPDGAPTMGLAYIYSELARGGVGLIITGNAFVSARGRGGPGCIGLHQDKLIPAHRLITESVRRERGVIFSQLLHSGSQLPLYNLGGLMPQAPSAIPDRAFPGVIPEEMTAEDIRETIADFARAAARAVQAGYQGVQLHAAHGYLLSQFRSPYSNRRNDGYGQRNRFVLETCEAVMKAVGGDFPVSIKLNARDYIQNGVSLEDTIGLVRELVDLGIDMIEVSGGVAASGILGLGPSRKHIRPGRGEAYFLQDALAVKSAAGSVPVALVGGIRSLETAENVIGLGIDLVSMSRPLIWEPNLVARWKWGDTRPALCVSCNNCFITTAKGRLACRESVAEGRGGSV